MISNSLTVMNEVRGLKDVDMIGLGGQFDDGGAGTRVQVGQQNHGGTGG